MSTQTATILQPESLNEISLKQYQKFLTASETLEGELLNHKMISLFCGMTLKESLMIKLTSVREIVNDINTLFEAEKPFQQRFFIGKVEFGFIPNLQDMSFGEFIDLDTNLGDWQLMNRAMATLYRPIIDEVGDKYEIEEYEGTDKYQEIMQFAPLGVVFGAVVFFWNLSNALLKAIQSSLVEELVQEATQEQSNLVKSGVGTQASMLSQQENLRELMKLLPMDLPNALPI